MRYKSHAEFLRKCINEGIISTGFHLKWDIQLDTDKVMLNKCDKIKKDASLKLMEITEQACLKKISLLQEQHEGEDVDDELIEQLDIEMRRKKIKKLEKVRKHVISPCVRIYIRLGLGYVAFNKIAALKTYP